MATQDKVMLMHKVEETLKPRMFANLLEEATEEIQEHLDEFDITHIAGQIDETEDLLETYIHAKRAEGLTEKTLTRYEYVISRFLKAVGLRTRDVTTLHIRSYFDSEARRGMKDSSIDGNRQVLNGYFVWLDKEKLIRSNPMSNIGSYKCEKRVKETFPETDIAKINRCCDNIRDLAIINFLLASGCRIGEVEKLNRDDINMQDGEFIVYGKGKKERTSYIDNVTLTLLKEYLATRADDNPALFIGKGGRRLKQNGYRCMMHKWQKKLGIAANLHPHKMRRTMITTMLDRGMPIQEVCLLVGHAKIDTTMKYYSPGKAKIKNSYFRYSGR